jgi:hypothetical protein
MKLPSSKQTLVMLKLNSTMWSLLTDFVLALLNHGVLIPETVFRRNTRNVMDSRKKRFCATALLLSLLWISFKLVAIFYTYVNSISKWLSKFDFRPLGFLYIYFQTDMVQTDSECKFKTRLRRTRKQREKVKEKRKNWKRTWQRL